MLSFRDCLDFAGVTEGEIDAIVKHSHIPPIVALELGHHLLQTSEGREKLRDIIVDDVRAAMDRNRCADCEKFSLTLSRYLDAHPTAEGKETATPMGLTELAAIGAAAMDENELGDPTPTTRKAVQARREAKERSDCCACAELSLALLRIVRATEQGDPDTP